MRVRGQVTGHRVITLNLPFPPSQNMYYRWARGRRKPYLSESGKAFRDHATAMIIRQLGGGFQPLEGKLDLVIDAVPGDRRKRDTDNMLKIPLDVLEHANVFGDDCQIRRITIDHLEPEKPGSMTIRLSDYLPK